MLPKLRDLNIIKVFITFKSLNHLTFKLVTGLISSEIVIQIFKKMETVLEKSFKSTFRKKPILDTHILSGYEGNKMFGCEIQGVPHLHGFHYHDFWLIV